MLRRTLLSFALASALATPAVSQLDWVESPAGEPNGGLELVYDTARQRAVGVRAGRWDMEVVESSGGAWQRIQTTSQPVSRIAAAVAFDGVSGRTLMFGGAVGGSPVGETWLWDGAAWSRFSGSEPSPRAGAALAYDAGRRRLVLHGGVAPGGGLLTDTWEWDGSSWSLRQSNGPPARVGHQMVYDGSRSAVLMCGRLGARTGEALVVWSYDGLFWSRLSLGRAPQTRADFALGFDPVRREVVMQGGVVRTTTGASTSVETWVLSGSQWTRRTAAAPLRLHSHQLAWDESAGRLLMFGGDGRRVTWTWTGSDWVPDPRRSTPLHAIGCRLVWDRQNQRTIMFGITPNSRFDSWSRTADGWDLIPGDPTAFSNGMRTGASAGFAYDTRRSRAVLFGGFQRISAHLVQEYDGTRWTMTTQSGPMVRINMLFVYDEARGVTLLFGGDFGGDLGDTWTWDGTSWTQLSPATSPSPRSSMAACYDPVRRRVVLFGGSSGADETWEWDGSNWSRRITATVPPGRQGASMVHDRARQRAVLFGGTAQDSRVWEYDGIDWTARSTPNPLPSRTDMAAVYDPVRRTTVVYGGRDAATRLPLGDTWELAPIDPADVRRFGSSCAGQGQTLRAESLPWIGGNLDLRATGFVPNTPVRVWFGFSDATWSGGSLPSSLGAIGMVGCDLLVSLNAEIGMLPGPEATLSVRVPNDPALLRGTVYLQAYGLAPGANPLGASVTNGLAAQFGGR